MLSLRIKSVRDILCDGDRTSISNNAHDNIEQPVGRKKEEKGKKKAINKVRPFSMHHLKHPSFRIPIRKR